MLRAAVANNEAADKDGFTPLYIAAENHAEIIERLLTTGVNEEKLTKLVGHHCTSLPRRAIQRSSRFTLQPRPTKRRLTK